MPRGPAKQPKSVETLTHEEARRRNLPSAEHQSLMREDEQSLVMLAYERAATTISTRGSSGAARTSSPASSYLLRRTRDNQFTWKLLNE